MCYALRMTCTSLGFASEVEKQFKVVQGGYPNL